MSCAFPGSRPGFSLDGKILKRQNKMKVIIQEKRGFWPKKKFEKQNCPTRVPCLYFVWEQELGIGRD